MNDNILILNSTKVLQLKRYAFKLLNIYIYLYDGNYIIYLLGIPTKTTNPFNFHVSENNPERTLTTPVGTLGYFRKFTGVHFNEFFTFQTSTNIMFTIMPLPADIVTRILVYKESLSEHLSYQIL